jgi:2-polyprenyl-3-methyl-5-hydroxy-6-metoxy-1,4-benzoquinol methylase
MNHPIYDGVLTAAALADPNNTHTILLQLVGTGRTVLEVGCATGYMTRVLVERQNCRVTGFEINGDAPAGAKPFLQRLIVGDLENPADVIQIQSMYDVILIADVIEHLAMPQEPLRALRHLLSDEGRLIISVPNVAHWSVRRALLFGHWDLADRGVMDRTHLRWYTRDTAVALLASTGYRLVRHRASYVFPAHWRLGWGQRIAAWAQAHTMPSAFDALFAIQHVFVAVSV